jgi:hypothetical protein
MSAKIGSRQGITLVQAITLEEPDGKGLASADMSAKDQSADMA